MAKRPWRCYHQKQINKHKTTVSNKVISLKVVYLQNMAENKTIKDRGEDPQGRKLASGSSILLLDRLLALSNLSVVCQGVTHATYVEEKKKERRRFTSIIPL